MKYRIVEHTRQNTIPYYTVQKYRGRIRGWVDERNRRQHGSLQLQFTTIDNAESYVTNLMIINSPWEHKIIREYE